MAHDLTRRSALAAMAGGLVPAAGLSALAQGADAGGPAAQGAPGVTTVPPDDVARTIRGVIELYTSQGCSSCPDADALLKQYAEQKDVVALTCPVDYWDYLGWKDTLASPRHTQRQRSYAKARGDGAVYTPQAVINGGVHVNGSSKAEIDRALERSWSKLVASQVQVRFWMQGGSIVIQAGQAPEKAANPEATRWLAFVQRSAEVEIKRGENAGRTITYYNVVREVAPVGMWTGKPTQIRLARTAVFRPETEACAVLVQAGEGGPIVGAAWMGF